MNENDCGKIAREQRLESAQIRQEFALDAFIVMPNHLHGILWILGAKGGRVLVNGGFGQPIAGADGVRPPDAKTPVGASRARPLAEPRSPFGRAALALWPSRARPLAEPRSPFGRAALALWPSHARPLGEPRSPLGRATLAPWASHARPLAERRSALQTPRNRRRPIPAMRPHSLASWAAGFKSAVTSRIRKLWDQPRAAVWQEDYFERIIRDEGELFKIREYILSNPARWKLDLENPEAGPGSEEEWPWNPDDDS